MRDLFVWARKRFKALLIWWLYQVLDGCSKIPNVFPVFLFILFWVDKQPLINQLLFIILHNFFDISSETYCKAVSIERLWNVSVTLCVGSGPEFCWKAILQTFGPPRWNAGFLFLSFSLSLSPPILFFSRLCPVALCLETPRSQSESGLDCCHVNSHCAANIHRHLGTRSFHRPEEPLMPQASP